MYARRLHRLHLLRRRALAARDDGARVAHAAPGRCRLAGDESDHGLLDVLLHVRGRLLLRVAAELADHHERARAAVLVEQLEGLGVVGADDGVAAEPDAGRLPDAEGGELVDGLVGERAAAAEHADRAALVDVARHDADLALLTGRDDAGAVGADQPSGPALQVL